MKHRSIWQSAKRFRSARLWSTAIAISVSFAGIVAAPAAARADTESGLIDFSQGRFAEAYQQWQGAADAGDARGALFLGVLYDTGEGVARDEGRALDWYRRSAGMGSAVGAFNVAVMYDTARGASRDTGQAITWYGRAAEGGYARADYNLGLIYEGGDGVPADRRRAIAFFRRAATLGLSAARIHLASLGSPMRGAARAVEDDASKEFAQAQQILLSRGPAAMTSAATLFRHAADHNNPLAEYDLAYCYEHGLGVQRDPSAADQLYRRAASHATDDHLRSIAETAVRDMGGQLTQSEPEAGKPPRP